MQYPREPHLHAALHMRRYLQKDPTLGIFMSSSPNFEIQAFCDSDWASCPDFRRSVSGYIVLLWNSLIGWKPKKQETISLSSTEAKYRSLRKVIGELVWLHKLLAKLIVPPIGPSPMFCGSQVVLHIVKNPIFHERTKHIEVDCHFVRSKFQKGLISLYHINTCDQLADILTKALTGIKHSTMMNKLTVITSPPT